MFFDARLIFFFALFGFHIRCWTFMLLVLAIAGFSGASYFNYTLENVVRLMRSKIVGPFRPAVAYVRLRPLPDYGLDCLKAPSRQIYPEADRTRSAGGAIVRRI